MAQKISIKEVKENPSNPRYIRDAKFKKLVKSIKEFPEMLEKRPIIVDENMVVLGGNMRLKACKAAGLFDIWIDKAIGWSEEQKKEFVIKDNVGFGEWDWDILANEWETEILNDWGLDLPKWENDLEIELGNDSEETYDYPEGLEQSHVKMVQLFLNTDSEPKFREMELELRKFFDTDNVTDTVYKALEKLNSIKDVKSACI